MKLLSQQDGSTKSSRKEKSWGSLLDRNQTKAVLEAAGSVLIC